MVTMMAYFVFSILYYMDRIAIEVRIIGALIALLGLYFYITTLICDPGIPKEVKASYLIGTANQMSETSQDSEARRVCPRCPSGRQLNPGDFHCRLCDVCIEGFHHHCIFYSKCIGQGNLSSFFGALTAVCVLAVYVSGMIVYD